MASPRGEGPFAVVNRPTGARHGSHKKRTTHPVAGRIGRRAHCAQRRTGVLLTCQAVPGVPLPPFGVACSERVGEEGLYLQDTGTDSVAHGVSPGTSNAFKLHGGSDRRWATVRRAWPARRRRASRALGDEDRPSTR